MDLTEAKKEIAKLKEQLEIEQTLNDVAFEAIGIFDENFKCVAANAEAENIFGYSTRELLGLYAFDFLAKDSHSIVKDHVANGITEPYFATCKRRDGTTFPVEIRGSNVILRGQRYRATAMRDLTFTRATEMDLADALYELELIFSNCKVGLMLLKGGRYLRRANQALADILGYESPDEIKGISMRQLHISLEKYDEFGATIYPELAHGKPLKFEYQMRRKDGNTIWCSFTGQAIDRNIPANLYKGILWVVDDITKRKAKEDHLMQMATTDDLTGALHRKEFFRRMKFFTDDVRHEGFRYSMLMIDLDSFKSINDTYGHEAGDAVLRDFAAMCKEQLRDNDLFARIGGEEFAVFLPQTTRYKAVQVAERLRKAFAEKDTICCGNVIPCTISVGVAGATSEYIEIEELLRSADQRLYRAKTNGRNSVVFFDD
ncbi:sensor domain-containing diguanylate cyclase [Halodesulfovibrio marinisediminis]|uniref:PAS domain S-box-containing protein/diguanylate cyclase (GGDEF) domain-containing protein n=1 Tax=Halodesulfovibrio marinisediminis DSM 17456 TaxID=1121457 RepID=A0A1N6E8D9_9BACT|nr:sensor domain-containing diguanylate cyclase [Halodesulfovibrio marinisediminis]SIN79298.1 PAS domain S-box-containing protein/diguanylate cyclase (GGDEF) domain-containing protein [Halodesulfovibrio marinisediminis DSM 17456]